MKGRRRKKMMMRRSSPYSFVIASEAKQSISQRKERMDCFVATLLAMTVIERGCALSVVMAGLVPAIHVFLFMPAPKTWMPGTSPGMTEKLTQSGTLKVIYTAWNP
jgi:hypothetical protein